MENEKVKELRERFAKIQYATSLEKDLQQELDETKDFEKRQNLTKKIEEVRETNNEGLKTQIVEEAEKAQKEAQDKINENLLKIEVLKNRNKQLQEQEKAITAEILENKRIIEIKKGKPSSKIYTSAKEENIELLKSKRAKILQLNRNNSQIKKLETEIEGLEDEILDLDDLIYEIKGKEIDEEELKQVQEEDEMWEQYRLEQETKKNKEIDEAFEDKEFQEKSEDKINSLLAYEDTQKWLNGDELKDIPKKDIPKTTTENVKPTFNQAPKTIVNPPETKTKPEEFQKNMERINLLFGNNSKEKQANQLKPEVEQKEICEIMQIGFRIQPNGNPEYYVIFVKDGKLDLETYNALSLITKMKAKDRTRLKDKKIEEPDKYYDIGLEKALKNFDIAHKTEYVEKYIAFMKENKKAKDREFKVSYDFTNLSIYKSKTARKLNYLMKIAKSNKKAGLAEYYKPGNIFKRIESKIKNSRFYSKHFLPVPMDYETVKKPTSDQIKSSFKDLHNEPGFDIEEFIKQNNFSDQTASEYRALKSKKGAEWRESLKAIKETEKSTVDPDFEEISKTVEQVQEENQK